MRCRVQVLRRDGRPLDAGERSAPIEGRLLTSVMPSARGLVATFQALGVNMPENELLPRLQDVQLVSVHGNEMRLRGLESLEDGRMVLQEWLCGTFGTL
jgi:hypothetical protein